MKAERRYELAEKKFSVKPTPEMLCPRWDRCDVNSCILQKDNKKLENTTGDKYKCNCPKLIRKQIGTYFKLKNGGLREREIAGAKRWANLSPEEKEARTKKLKENSPFVRLKSKGYGIVRVGKNKSKLTQATNIETPKNISTNHNKASNNSFLLPTPVNSGVSKQTKLIQEDIK